MVENEQGKAIPKQNHGNISPWQNPINPMVFHIKDGQKMQ